MTRVERVLEVGGQHDDKHTACAQVVDGGLYSVYSRLRTAILRRAGLHLREELCDLGGRDDVQEVEAGQPEE